MDIFSLIFDFICIRIQKYHGRKWMPSVYNCSSRVPGLAFKNGQEYVELNESELQRLAYTESQRLFYQVIVQYTEYLEFNLNFHSVKLIIHTKFIYIIYK